MQKILKYAKIYSSFEWINIIDNIINLLIQELHGHTPGNGLERVGDTAFSY